MQNIQVARYKLTDLQSEFSRITAFWQDHSNKTAVLLSQSKAQLIKGKEREGEGKEREREGEGREAQILLLCTHPSPLAEKDRCLLTITEQSSQQ